MVFYIFWNARIKCYLNPQQFEGQFPNASQCPFPVNIWAVTGARASRASQRCAGLALNVRSVWWSFLLSWQVQFKVIHILIISCGFLSSGFNCPQLKVINERGHTEELQQNSGGKGEVLGVGCSCQRLPSQGSPWLLFYSWGRETSILQKGQSKDKRQFSLYQCKTRLHSGR